MEGGKAGTLSLGSSVGRYRLELEFILGWGYPMMGATVDPE